MRTITLDGRSLGPDDVAAILEGSDFDVVLDADALARIEAARATVEKGIEDGRTIYGVNTGFGKLADQSIPPDQVRTLQRNLLLSHACGVGPALPDEIVALAMLFRANSLAVGCSGCRPIVVETLVKMLKLGVRPVVPRKGSVGACGDLAPLAHLALPMIGEGKACLRGEEMEGARAMARAGVTPITLEAKEGLALINGVQISSAIGARVLYMAGRLLRTADLAAAMSLEALLGTDVPFDPRIHAARPHPGQGKTAENVRTLLADSEILVSHREHRHKVQDAYSLRCVPQVHGASRDSLEHAATVVYREVNSATDNPLVFAEEGDVLSGGNFHGEPVAMVMDHSTLALHELGSISERRIESIVNPSLSSGLPPFLAIEGGLHSGFMMAQVTAAALVCETRTLCHPASAESIPTSANQEDHVSMSTVASRKALHVADDVGSILAIEILAASRGLDLRKPLAPGKGVKAAYDFVRGRVPAREEDRMLAPEIEKVRGIVLGEGLLEAVEKVVGPLIGIGS
ncbi:MAG: histidine ammonia-lyase [Planctomycetota bacterium]